MKICVTGAAGRAGRVAVSHLIEHGHDVRAVDSAAPPPDGSTHIIKADLTEYGEAVEALAGQDVVLHLANIPAPEIYTPSTTFNRNTAMNSNVFLAAAQLGLQRVVWASSETTLGLPFDTPPQYAPVDEAHYPHPTSTYSLSKVIGETTAEHVSAWSGIPFVGLRFSNILGPADYERFPSYWQNPMLRKWNLWGYVDVRDVAQACLLALEGTTSGSQNFIIAADDTVMPTPSRDLMAAVFPEVEIRGELRERETLLSNAAAKRALGFQPQHSWRDHLITDRMKLDH